MEEKDKNVTNDNKIANKKEEELNTSTDESEKLNKKNNFFNKSMGAINLANKAAGGMNRGLNNMAQKNAMANGEGLPDNGIPNTKDELRNMGNSAVRGIGNAAKGINNIKNFGKKKDKEDEKEEKDKKEKKDNNKDGENNKRSLLSPLKDKFSKKNNSKSDVKNKVKKDFKTFIKALPVSIKLWGIGILVTIILVIFFVILFSALFGSSAFGSSCDAEVSEQDLLNYINVFESNGGYCDEEKTQYVAYQVGSDSVTIGYGVTSDYIDGLVLGDCIPVEEVDSAQLKAINAKRNNVTSTMNKYDVKLTNYQEDALTSMAYNGCSGFFDGIAEAILTEDYSLIWDSMKGCTNGGMLGLMLRRKAEFALFTTGDYTEAEKYKNLSDISQEDYDNYNYDDIMSRKDSVVTSCTSFGGKFIYPFNQMCVLTSAYGWRIHPKYMTLLFHDGIDLACPDYSDVIASGSGVVIESIKEYSSTVGYGAYVIIEHDNEYRTRYGHLSNIEVDVGDQVSQGQIIGQQGTSGTSTGQHLHFEIIHNGSTVDPAEFIDLKGMGD